ncbi:branched-chain amino acid ABC transporter permease [Xenophilus aerolatus]|nr:branched-chain amino acid ABC transporter permease [Xenophilus aerolatus]
MKLERWLPWCALAALAVFPLLAPAMGLEFYVNFVRRALIFALAAASLNFILGFGGMAALGHMGFVGVGAYTLVALSDAGHASAWLMWPAGAVAGGLVAAAIGSVALRTRGVYFIMITLAFAQMLYFAAVSLRAYGGDDGYNLMARPTFGLGLDSTHEPTFYWVVLALFAGVMALLNRATVSRFGHALMGIRDNEVRMQAMGYPVFRLRLAAFALAGAVAGLAGALLVSHNSFVSPSVMHWTQSATLVVMVVIGGVGRRWGGPVGAAVWIGLEEIARQHTEYWHLPLGVLLVAIVFLAPRGIAGVLERRRRAASVAPAADRQPAEATP